MIQSFVIHNCLCFEGGVEPIPADTWREQRRLLITGLTYRDKQPFKLTFTPTNLESPINLHVFGLLEEARVPGGDPGTHGENMQTPHWKVQQQPGIEPRTLSMLGNSANH